MRKYIFTVEGHPKGKGRHRDGKGKRKFTPEDTTTYQEKIRLAFRKKHCGNLLTTNVKYSIYIDIFYKTQIADIDNILKIVMDALTGMIWSDDNYKQVIGCDGIEIVKSDFEWLRIFIKERK